MRFDILVYFKLKTTRCQNMTDRLVILLIKNMTSTNFMGKLCLLFL